MGLLLARLRGKALTGHHGLVEHWTAADITGKGGREMSECERLLLLYDIGDSTAVSFDVGQQ